MAKKTINIDAQANKLKISLVITGGIDPDIDTVGDAVNMTVTIGSQKLLAPLNPKSFRKVQAAIKANGANAVCVLLTGELDLQARKILAAGIAAQLKTQKPNDAVQETVAPTAPVVPIDAVPKTVAPTAPMVVIKKQRIPEAHS